MAAKRQQHCSSPHQQKEWRKGNLIGSGSFGSVHLAMDSTTGTVFVAKSARSDAGISSLHNESNILENLDSPYIVKCIGKDVSASSTKNTLFFEYMAGGSLSDVAHNFGGALDEKLVSLYTRRILQGLEYLHRNGIVHCDVKCKNVLVSASGEVKLADFGCARRLTDRKSNAAGGTPLWMAPEVLRNEPLDFTADIWSLGCTVIEMATGRPPWGSESSNNPMAAMLRIAKGNDIPEFPQHLSPEGLDFLSKCLERDPKRRWTSRRLLSHPFVAEKSTYEETARSPTSVLDAPIYDSDEDEEFVSRIVGFRGTGCLLEKFPENYVSKKNEFEKSSSSSEEEEEEWITVRE